MAWWIILSLLAAAVLGVGCFLRQPSFGRAPSGARLERILRSPNYHDGAFRNRIPTPSMTGEGGRWQVLWKFLFERRRELRPAAPLRAVHTDLRQLPPDRDLMVWFGHSSYLLQVAGKRILVDPVFDKAAPVSFVNRPFAGTDLFRAEEMPDIDLLVITHDHWDHLDCKTVKALRDRVGRVVCPLGVGEHLEYWGYDREKLSELDWSEQTRCDSLVIHCLPARHFSGRGLSPNKTLWASFLIETPTKNLFLGGDGGYGPHFGEIGRAFPRIDWAFLENGQYNVDWRYIHTLPSQLRQVVADLHARHVVTVHHSKYALSRHPWDEPLKNAAALKDSVDAEVLIPLIGEVVSLERP